ncbi:rod shape-determining protein, partial [candidate division KSB1 bacterium]
VITSPSAKNRKTDDFDRQAEAPIEFIKHMIGLANPQQDQEVFLIVGAPAEATTSDKQAIINAASGLVDSTLVVSQPFLVAYGLGIYGFSMIVDIGAGTTDVCRMHGTLPDETDQRTFFKAGSYIDDMLFDLLKAKYPNGHITKLMAKKFKEKHAFVGEINQQISEELLLDGKPSRCDITSEVKDACESIVNDMNTTMWDLITSYDPDFQVELRNNIILAGCVSQMKGLPGAIEQGLTGLGPVNVKVVDDPVYIGAIGALKLAQDMPVEEWEQI